MATKTSLVLTAYTPAGEKKFTLPNANSAMQVDSVKKLTQTLIENNSVLKYMPTSFKSARIESVISEPLNISD